ncbi:MAG: PKD domain-containing protein [Clostridia bacterium]
MVVSFDTFGYIGNWNRSTAKKEEIRSRSGHGDSAQNPIYVHRESFYSGAFLHIGNIHELFYNEDNRSKGGSHLYVDGFHVWIGSLRWEKELNEEGIGWELFTYEGQNPNSQYTIDVPDIGWVIDSNPADNGLVLSVWLRRWQIWPNGAWDWWWDCVKRLIIYTDIGPSVYLEPIDPITRSVANAVVTVDTDSSYVGITPCTFTPQVPYSGTKTHTITIYPTSSKLKDYIKPVNLDWTPRDTVFLAPTLGYNDCANPVGKHGDFVCAGYDRMKCNAGTWETYKTNAETCGYTKPTAAFSANYNVGSPPVEVQFTDQSTGDVKARVWSFGDGTGSSEKNPTHIYTSPGTHKAFLEVSNEVGSTTAQTAISVLYPCTEPDGSHSSEGCVGFNKAVCNNGIWDVTEENAESCGYPAPIASFTTSVAEGIAPLEVTFEDTSIQYPSEWHWDFGDGTESNERHPRHIYEESGTYTATLTTSNHIGSSSASATITVWRNCSDPDGVHGDETCIDYDNMTCNDGEWEVIEPDSPSCGYPPPIAAFTPSVTSGDAPLEVQFTDMSTREPVAWHWDFGDGTESDEQSPTHIYENYGVYIATLCTSNHAGESTASMAIIVYNKTAILLAGAAIVGATAYMGSRLRKR